MKTKFTIMLTAFLMLFCVGANAQVKGDVNGDGNVTNADIEEVVKIITGTSQLENADVVGDVTGDGHVNVADIVSIVNIMMYPVQEVGNPVISINVRLINNSGVPVTLDGDLKFILGNPDHYGYELGWSGLYNETDHIVFSDSPVILAADEKRVFTGVSWCDEDTQQGLGRKSPATEEQLAATERPRNVLLYVNGISEIVMCENMSSDIEFEDGKTYDIVITSAGSSAPIEGNPPVSINLKIVNNTGTDVLLNGDLKFTLGNPDRNGNYFGWAGPYTGTDHIFFSQSPVSFAAGDIKTFNNVRWVEPETGWGLGGKSPANAEQLAAAERPRNVLVYVLEPDGTANSEIVMCENMDPNIVFTEGGEYTITLTSAGGYVPTPTPTPTPVDPSAGNPPVSINLKIVNNTGTDVLLNGDLKFTLGNPDRNGNYFGWAGPYTGTDHIFFSQSPVSFAAGDIKTFNNVRWVEPETGWGLGGKSPANAEQLAAAERPRNVLVYVLEPDGTANSEIVMCENMDPNIVFTEGGEYTITLTSAGGYVPTPVPVTPTGDGNPVITIGVRIHNTRNSAVTLDGDLKFTLGNPDHYGRYFGWAGPYTGTPHLRFSPGAVTLAAGEVRDFYGVTWMDDEIGWGLGQKSPADAAQLAASERPRNVVLYVGGNSEIYLCDNMSSNIEFADGQIYDIYIR